MTPDKSKQLSASVSLINENVHFMGTSGTNQPVSMDYFPPVGDNLGYTGLELFLVSLAGCLGSAVAPLLRKMGKTVSGLEINATGIRREKHPTCFSTITLLVALKSPDTTEPELQEVIALSEEKICPVLAMIKGNVEVLVKGTVCSTGNLAKS
jgi:putative redox protein